MIDRVASVDGVELAYEVHGTGRPALVFVHGWACDRSYWDRQAAALRRKFKTVAIDLAGHGASGLERESWTIAAFGSDVAAVVNDVGLDSMVLVGHSMGGDVIVDAARAIPGRVQGLIWVDSYRRLPDVRSPDQIQERLAPFRARFVETTQAFVRDLFAPGADPPLVARIVADMSSAPPAIAIAALESTWMHRSEMHHLLHELNLSLTAINSDRWPTEVDSLERHGAKVVLMSGVGHFPMMENPARFDRLLIEAVEELVARHLS